MALSVNSEAPMKTSIRTLAASLAVAVIFPNMAPGDSTGVIPPFNVPVKSAQSLLGRATDRKTCKYHADDSKIHCVYDSGTSTSFIATSIITPDFPQFGRATRGNVNLPTANRIAFLNAEHATRISGQSAAFICRVALEFVSVSGNTFWIWHDELKFGSSAQMALVDSNGDGIADKAIRGSWNGGINGTRKWWTPDPYNSTYSAADRDYPTRPVFTPVNGRQRGCKPVHARIAVLADAASRATD